MKGLGKIGGYAFLLGILLAIIGPYIPFGYMSLLLVIMGLIVGYLNVTDKEMTPFLVAALALAASKGVDLSKIPILNYIKLNEMVANLVVFILPAALIVAIVAIYKMGKN